MHSHRFTRKLMIAMFVLASAAIAEAQRGSFPDFSATQIFEVAPHRHGDDSSPLRSSVRVERGAAMSTLYVPSKSKVYNFTTYPDHSHHCVVMNPDQTKMLPSPLELLQGADLKRTPHGTQVVEGHLCDVENVVVTRPDGKTIESKAWAQDLKGVPVKIESHLEDITLSAFPRDISRGKPDQGLFTIPEKCTAIEKMGQVAEERILIQRALRVHARGSGPVFVTRNGMESVNRQGHPARDGSM